MAANFTTVTRLEQKPKTQLIADQIGITGLATFGHTITDKPELTLLEHHHRTKLEFIIVLEGMQKFIVSNVEYTLYGGEVFIIQPNETHACGQNIGTTELLWFQIDLSLAENFLNLPHEMAEFMLKRITFFDGRKFSASDELIEGFLTAFKLFSTGKIGDRIKGQSAFTYNLISLLEKTASMTALSPVVDNAKQYILTHIEDKFDIDMLIGKNNITHSEFREMFKEQVGYTPRDFINMAKVNAAKEVIATTKISINDIAYEFCFSSVHYFKVIFKQYTNFTPKEYRKKHRTK